MLAELLAIFLEYPEILHWERLWHASAAEVHKMVYDSVKAIRPNADMGRHVDHRESSWDLFYRAGSRYQGMTRHADSVKPILYHDILGPRLKKNYLDALEATILRAYPQKERKAFTLTPALSQREREVCSQPGVLLGKKGSSCLVVF